MSASCPLVATPKPSVGRLDVVRWFGSQTKKSALGAGMIVLLLLAGMVLSQSAGATVTVPGNATLGVGVAVTGLAVLAIAPVTTDSIAIPSPDTRGTGQASHAQALPAAGPAHWKALMLFVLTEIHLNPATGAGPR